MGQQTSIKASLSRDNGATYDTIGGITGISYSGLELSAIDSSNLNSTNQHRTFLGGMIDPGTVDVTGNFNPTIADTDKQLLVRGDLTGRVVTNYKITFPDGETVILPCLVTNFGVEAGDDSMLAFNVSLKVSGELIWADT